MNRSLFPSMVWDCVCSVIGASNWKDSRAQIQLCVESQDDDMVVLPAASVIIRLTLCADPQVN